MNEAMKQTKTVPVAVEALTPGMVLAEDLRHFNGRLILKKGSELSAKELRIIKMWGITEAKIQITHKPGNKPEAEKEPAADEKIEAKAREFFRFTDLDHEVNKELFRLFLHRYPEIEKRESSPLPVSTPEEKVSTIDIREKIKENIELPSLPDIVIRINEAIGDPNCTATHIANIINKDSSLTASLLKLVNSGFYNFPTAIESIPRAVTIIGTLQLSTLAMATAVTSTFGNIPPGIIDMKSFWKHSLACGIICRLIASYKINGNINTESYFLAGLLHDIGRLVIYQYFPREAKGILSQVQAEPQLLYQVEPGVLKNDHAEVGSILIEQWKLPPILQNACLYHHAPLKSPDKMVSSVVHLADIIVNAMQLGSSGERYVPPLNPEAWKHIDLPASVLSPILQQTNGILKETIQTYLHHE